VNSARQPRQGQGEEQIRHPNRKIATAVFAALALLALAFAASAQAATEPVLTIEDASQVTVFGAKLSGTVDPSGADSSCRFAFVTEAKFQVSGFENLSDGDYVSCDVNPVTGSGAQPVSAQSKLRPNTTYHFALEATNTAGTSFLENVNTFTTPAAAPEVTTGPNTPFPGGKVHLLGYVDPEESSVTSCKFIYGTEPGNYPQEAPCANHPGNEIQALHVAANGGTYRLFDSENVHRIRDSAIGDLTKGSNLITDVSFLSGEFIVGQPLIDNEPRQGVPLGLAPNTRIAAIGPDTIEINIPAVETKTATRLQSEHVEETSDITSFIPFDASATEVQSALEGLPEIGGAGVSVTQRVALPDYHLYLVTFEGPLADTNVSTLSGAAEPLESSPGQTASVLAETFDEGGLGGPHEVTAELSGLTAGATYHYRLVAANGAGPEESADAVFKAAEEEPNNCTTADALGASFLPECRAYEMVSPPDKNGGDVLTLSEGTRVASDGSAASFPSPSPFLDASGAGIDSEYESIRTALGWQTHGIFPQQPPGTFEMAFNALIPHYMGEFSSDVNRGIFFAIRPLDESDPNVEAVVNLYLRTDLRTPGSGTYQLLTGCPLCAEKSPPQPLSGYNGELAPWVVAASSDLKHVVFESYFNLVKGVNSPAVKLYESEEGTVRLVGILLNGTAAVESTAAGKHSPNRPPLNVSHTVSTDGSKIVWTDGTNVYLRLNHETTIRLNESELSPSGGNGTAKFQDATPTSSKVFFTDSTRLSEDAPEGGGLYVYDTTKPASDPHNLSFIAVISGPVVGVSADGETVYYGHSLWHEGEVRSIGSFQVSEEGRHFQAQVSPDGKILFKAQSNTGELPHLLQPQFPGYCPDTFRPLCGAFYTYDPSTEALQCVSCPQVGQATQDVATFIERSSVGGGANFRRKDHPMSTDGRHVFFATNAALVPEDTNGVSDVYTFNTATSQVSLISRGTDPFPSYFMEATPDGSNALFTTRQRLSGWDVDTNTDLYDARVDGGLPEPLPTSGVCEGEPSCRPAATQPVNPKPTSSESILSGGNPAPRCQHGTHLVRRGGQTRCVKSRHHKKKRRHAKRGDHK